MSSLDEMIAEIRRRQTALANPAITIKRPPWWRPFARRRFDREVEGLRAFYRAHPSGVAIVKMPSPPSMRN